MKFINEDKIPELLSELTAAGKAVWAPQVPPDSGGAVLFSPWREGDEVVLQGYTVLSAKEAIMPATEKLFSYSYVRSPEGETIEIDDPEPPAEEKVIFGARACDAKALTVLDALFGLPSGRAYNDPYYKARRANLKVITLACTTCDAACFCSSFNGPAEKAGSDVFLYPVEGGYLAEAITDQGRDLIAGGLFTESQKQIPELAETAMMDPEHLEQKLADIFADLDFWNSASDKCLSCGYCTYCCPTCYCFNIFDEMRSDREGERLRAWDACMFHLYTEEASGHNPRPTIAHRYRNRINHKFSYFPANQGEILCTGCGRCIRGCPAGIDLREVLRAVSANENKNKESIKQVEA